MKAIEVELSEIKKKMCSPVAIENLLDDTVLSTAFPTIWRLLKVYVIIPFSEVVVERGFSKMNLIMTKKRCPLDSINLETLMWISFRKKKLEGHEIEEVIDIWKNTKNRVIFSLDLWLFTETSFSLNIFIEAIWLLWSLQIWYYI